MQAGNFPKNLKKTRGSARWACVGWTRSKNCLWRPCLITDRDEISNLDRGPAILRRFLPSFGLFGKEVSAQKIFRNWPIRNKNCLWWPCLSTDRNEISTIYREPSIDASYQVSVHLVRQFQGKIFFRNWPTRNKNCIRWPCLFTDRDEKSNLYRGHFIDASYQLWLCGFRGKD